MPDLPITSAHVLLAHGGLAIVLSLVAWSILVGRHDRSTTVLWCLGGVLFGASLVLLALLADGARWFGSAVVMGLALAGYALRIAALYREVRSPFPWAQSAVALGSVTFVYVAAGEWNSTSQEWIGAVARGAAALWMAAAAWGIYRFEGSRSAALIAATGFALSAAFALRGITILAVREEVATSTFDNYLLVNTASVLVTLFSHVGYVGLAWERARSSERDRAAALEIEHARLLKAETDARELDALRAGRREVINESAPAMMHSIDAEGRLVAVSDTWLHKLGYSRQEVIGRLSTEFLSPSSRDFALRVAIPEFFRTGRIDNLSYEFVCKDGGILDVRLSAVLERDAHGAPFRSIAVLEDVSDLRARQAELEREQAQRLEAERQSAELNALLAERTEMLRVLAHEVRQPLNNASAALQTADAALKWPSTQSASSSMKRAQGVLNEVLASLDNTLAVAAVLAAGEAHARDSDVDTLLGIVVEDMPEEARCRVRLDRATPTRTVAWDPALMRLALRNLISNALTYSAPGSEVVVRVLDEEKPLALLIEVCSSGQGIDQTLVPRLFQRGTRGQSIPDRPGSGLGLYIVKRVMQMHRGAVELVSNSDAQVVFRLTIPQDLDD